jgi:hypothetical protein
MSATAIIDDEMQVITQEAEVKYFHMMLNMAEDELDQPEYRLLGHYVRWAGHGGMEQEGIRQTATRCHMGTDMVEKTREALVSKGYLRVTKPSDEERKNGVATKVIVVDRWMENTLYCQNKYKVYLSGDTTAPDSLPQAEGGVPEQVDSEDSQSTIQSTVLVAPVAATMTTDPISDAKTKPAPEPTLHTPFRAITPLLPDMGEAVSDDEKPNRTKKGRKRAEGVIPAECFKPMQEAIMKAFGWAWGVISDEEVGQVRKAAKSLCKVSFPLDKIPDLYTYCQGKFKTFGPVALTTHQSDFRKTITPSFYNDEAKAYAKAMYDMVFGS